MSKKNETGYLSAKESRRISRENRRITDQLEKRHKRKNVPESEYLTQMKDPNNALEIENLHTYFFSDVGTVRAVDGVSFDVPIGKTVGVVADAAAAAASRQCHNTCGCCCHRLRRRQFPAMNAVKQG